MVTPRRSPLDRLREGHLFDHLVCVDEMCLWACAAWWLAMSVVNLDNSTITRTLHSYVHASWLIQLALGVIVVVHGVGIFFGPRLARQVGMDLASVWWVLVTFLQVSSDPLNTATGSYGLVIVPLALWRTWALHHDEDQ